ncbi:NEL-type E3 ubiquitin ligase domain-containing protein [Pseudomonas japonica]|uniref:NEL-type E3 ubiquitin ligase domain-containing protein n=1 Tax=Pseudomonas japonica TaxID=256466 RepID=UPI00380A19E7
MADLPAVDTPEQNATPGDLHYRTVSQRVPQWLIASTPQQRQALRASVPRPMPWLAEAGQNLPEALAALREEGQRQHVLARAVEAALQALPSVEAFAEPLLRNAIKERFGLDLDVRRTFLFNAARARIDEALIDDGDPVVRAFQVVKAATQSLLAAALQNFEAFEAQEGGMRDEHRRSTIFSSSTGQLLEPAHELDLPAERFAALCRELDLGGQYQQQIAALFRPRPEAGNSEQVAVARRQDYFKRFEVSTFRLNLHLAWLQSWISQDLYDELQAVANNGPAKGELKRAALKLWEVQLNGIVLFFRLQPGGALAGRLLVYMPDEPRQPFEEFESIQAFNRSLCERLRDATWRTYFLRFVPARERDHLLQRIHRTLNPKVWNPGGWYEERPDPEAILRLGRETVSGPLFDYLLQRKIAVLKDDGLFHAVPTAQEDHKSARDKVNYYLGAAFNVLNVAAFVVPGLGEAMLAVNAAMLGYEVYEGFDSLSRGEREEAWGYFMDVGENLAIMAALGAAGAAAHRFEVNLPLAVRSMRPVTLADGSVRLWKPDLAPFAYSVRLPTDLSPGANGLYDWQGRDWLALEGRYYSVRTLMGAEQGYRLEHPERSWAYEPELRHNGNGGWLHEMDTPEQWHGLQLFRRQGHREATVSADMARRALRISGVSEAQLRQSLKDSRRPPALLTDTLRRLELGERLDAAGRLDGNAFELAYRDLQPPLSTPGQLLQGQFASLPNGVVEEIIAGATGHELDDMAIARRVPLRLAEEARVYQQQLRIARACEGLYLDTQASADSASLMLHGLETLAHWPGELRIGLYQGGAGGRRLAAIGSGQGEETRIVWAGQRPREFCQVLFDAIPAETRTTFGFDTPATLRATLQEQPLAAQQRLRQWLGMQPLKPGFRSPMRLAHGRIGYPLSGRGDPFFTEDELLDKLRLLELEDLYAEDALQALYRAGMDRSLINTRLDRLLNEMLQLRTCLDRWALDSAGQALAQARQRGRERIGQALWDFWRHGVLPELGRPTPRLTLWQVQLADLPTELPAFFRERVREVLLDDVWEQDGEDDARAIDGNRLRTLAWQFPGVTSLDIRSGAWAPGLAQAVAHAWPRLTALGLRELAQVISHQDLRALATLAWLRRLSLRGSRIGDMPISALNGMVLDYLGLDLLGLEEWPQWLDNLALDRIGEVSLVGNALREVPAAILADGERVIRPMRIFLQGNRFDQQAMLDMALAQRFQGRFIFELDLSAHMTDALYQRVLERAQLQAVLHDWAEPVQPSTSLSAEHQAYRQRLCSVYLEFWREEVRGTQTAGLVLEDLVLEDMPGNLPPFFAPRVQRLELRRFSARPGTLERVLRQFPQVRQLTLANGDAGLTGVPGFLASFAYLRHVALLHMDLSIDQTAMNVFARMPALSSLHLDGNRLGAISDVSRFNLRYLSTLRLAQMRIDRWPAWIDPLLPDSVGLLCLDDNQIDGLPAHLLENRPLGTGAVEISLRDNPLSREVMIQAHLSQFPGRPYLFIFDLPADVAAMERPITPGDGAPPNTPEPEGAASDDDSTSSWRDLLDRLDLLELDQGFAGTALQALHRSGLDRDAIDARLNQLFEERDSLQRYLERWTREGNDATLEESDSRSRERIANALWGQWRDTLLPEVERPLVPLILWQVQLAELPLELPDFLRQRVRAVLLDDPIQREGDGVQRTIGEAGLQTLARQFPNLVSLDIRGGEWSSGLAQWIARAWPQLAAVGLRELHGMLGHQDLRALVSLPQLRRLELRGSRLRDMPAATLHGAHLDYLGLDWLDLQEWPQWLDNIALARISELSLVGNQLSEVPLRILTELGTQARPLRVAAQGNQFGHQALLDMLLAERFRGRFSFDLNLSPGLADVLHQRVMERVQLQSALELWVDPALTPAMQEPEQLTYRHRIAGELLNHWREEVRGGSTAVLSLNNIVLDDFPGNLPAFFGARVQRLDLARFQGGAASLERFIRQFPQLRELSLIRGESALQEVPVYLEQISQLRELALVHMGMTIDQAAMEAFSRMPLLSSLQLDGNRLGAITDVSMLNQRFFGFFSMAQMQISTWPAWLGALLPDVIELLCLDDNQLSVLPEPLLENRRTVTGSVEISLRNNPLTRETLIRAHTSQHFDRPYSFTLDLPEDIAAMEYEIHTSDSEDSDLVEEDPMSDNDPYATWETGRVDQDLRNQLIWSGLAARGDAGSLLGLVNQLRFSADYRSMVTRPELIERVWTVLTAAARDTELRQTLNGMAEEPVQQAHSHETCPDGIRLEFNQMEFQVHTRQALREVSDEDRGPSLFRLMRSIFRAQTLDRIAREQSNGRDEAEVRLAYRLRWAEALQLPAPPRSMLYRGAANLAAGELDQAMTRLQVEEAGPELQRFAGQCDFWVAYLRETFAERFKSLRQTYEAAVLNAIDAYPDESAEQSSTRIAALEQTFKQDEQALLEHLTLEYAMNTA